MGFREWPVGRKYVFVVAVALCLVALGISTYTLVGMLRCGRTQVSESVPGEEMAEPVCVPYLHGMVPMMIVGSLVALAGALLQRPALVGLSGGLIFVLGALFVFSLGLVGVATGLALLLAAWFTWRAASLEPVPARPARAN